MRPMLATRGAHVPAGEGWAHEALGLSAQQGLRQPSYQGIRADLTPADLGPDA